MKFLFASLLTLLSFCTVVAQKIDPASIARLSPEKQSEVNEYVRKANNSRTAALILCIGGGSLAVAGMAVAISELNNDVWFDGVEPTTSNTGEILFFTGAACALGSIPFFLNIHKQRDKARAVLYSEKGVSIAPQILLPKTQSMGIKFIIPIGK